MRFEAIDLLSAVPGASGAAAEGFEAAGGAVPGSTDAGAAGAGASNPILSGETAFCEGLRPSWAKPEATAPPANIVPKSQPSNVRVFIYPHELLMV